MENRKNVQIEGLRGIGVLTIVFYHTCYRFPQIYTGMASSLLGRLGRIGVTLFLIISGCFVQNDQRSPFKYLYKKVKRIWPMYFFSISVIFFVLQIFPLPKRMVGFGDYILNVTFANGFIGTPYVDGAHWYLTVLIGSFLMIAVLKIFRLDNKSIAYFIWIFAGGGLLRCCNPYICNLFCGSYAGIIITGIAISHLRKNFSIQWFLLMLCGVCYTAIYRGIIDAVELCGLLVVIWLAFTGRMTVFERKELTYLGGKSFVIYLFHQNLAYEFEYWLYSKVGRYNDSIGVATFILTILLICIISELLCAMKRVLTKDQLN